MARPSLAIYPEYEKASESIHYRFRLRYTNGRSDEVLFYDVLGAPEAVPVEVFDGALCATVLYAMRRRLDIHLHGPASDAVLRNLREFQLAWSRWLPHQFEPVHISVDTVVDRPRVIPPRSIAAFSGGVDSLFTVLRHNTEDMVPPHRVDGVLLVHGFDVNLDNSADLDELIDRTAELRALMAVSLRVVRTNSKSLFLQKWGDTFGAELAGCMHFCSSEFSEGLIGSSEPYDGLVLPWGSNPVTDHLLSGGAMKITHDGAAFSRTDKVGYLSRHSEAVRALKVCHEGERQGRNCGVCEKCIRTHLNFLANGVANPPCFDQPLDLGLISKIWMRNGTIVNEFRSIYQYARQHEIDGPWVQLLGARLRTVRLKRVIKNSLARLRLLDQVKELQGRLRTGRLSLRRT